MNILEFLNLPKDEQLSLITNTGLFTFTPGNTMYEKSFHLYNTYEDFKKILQLEDLSDNMEVIVWQSYIKWNCHEICFEICKDGISIPFFIHICGEDKITDVTSGVHPEAGRIYIFKETSDLFDNRIGYNNLEYYVMDTTLSIYLQVELDNDYIKFINDCFSILSKVISTCNDVATACASGRYENIMFNITKTKFERGHIFKMHYSNYMSFYNAVTCLYILNNIASTENLYTIDDVCKLWFAYKHKIGGISLSDLFQPKSMFWTHEYWEDISLLTNKEIHEIIQKVNIITE